MKRFIALVVAAVLICLPVPVFADSTILLLYNDVSGTTSPVTTPALNAPFIVSGSGCDIITTPTFSVTVLFKGGNAYKDVQTFDGFGLATATTCTTGACNVQFTKTFRTMQAVFTAQSTTQTVTIHCTVR
jgi:hypothetical protein